LKKRKKHTPRWGERVGGSFPGTEGKKKQSKPLFPRGHSADRTEKKRKVRQAHRKNLPKPRRSREGEGSIHRKRPEKGTKKGTQKKKHPRRIGGGKADGKKSSCRPEDLGRSASFCLVDKEGGVQKRFFSRKGHKVVRSRNT